MNSAEEIIKDDNFSNDQDSLEEQLEDLERWNNFLENESIFYQRRLWANFMDMVCAAHIIERLKKECGEDDAQRVIDDFIRYEKPTANRQT